MVIEAEKQREAQRIAAEKAAKKKKKIAIISVSSVAAVTAIVILLTTVIIPFIKYSSAVSLVNDGKYDEAVSVFIELGDYSDSVEKIPETKYAKAVSLMNDGRYDEAVIAFKELGTYNNSVYKINETKYAKAVSLMNGEKYEEAIAVFKELNGYNDSYVQIIKCENEIFNDKYQNAISFVEDGKYDEAISAFIELGDYSDSSEKAKETSIMKIKNNAFGQGDKIVFGDYIWIVLKKTENSALIITEECIRKHVYNETKSDITWEDCSLRKYLNNEFYNEFSDSEKDMIIETVIVNNDNTKNNTIGGNDTKDKIFLLSEEEVTTYFSSYIDRAAKFYGKDCLWWLRSPGIDQNYAACVDAHGDVGQFSQSVTNMDVGVRPAMWINL